MNRKEAIQALGELSQRLDGPTDKLATIITETLQNPAIPMLMRVRAMAHVIAGTAEGLASVAAGDDGHPDPVDINRVHQIDQLPDIILTLRCAADLLEDANKLRTH